MNSPSLKTRLFFQILRNAQFGTLELVLPHQEVKTFGKGSPHLKVEVLDWKAIELIFNKGDIGLAEAVIQGILKVNDTAALVEWACRNDSALDQALNGTWFGTLLHKIRLLMMKKNERKQALKNIEGLDELGNEFYRLWLDSSMTYSSGLYRSHQETLDQAQNNKHQRILDSLNVQDSDHVLDLGCGWAGFIKYAYEKSQCQLTGIAHSKEQIRDNLKWQKENQISSRVRFQHKDYRDIEGVYDKIVCVEMFEVIGENYWELFFEKINKNLKSGGKFLLQTATIQNQLFHDYRRTPDFIQENIFPGGLLSTKEIIHDLSKKQGLKLLETFEFPSSYITTLQQWQKNFLNSLDEIQKMGFDEKFIRKWHLYLTYCEGTLRAERISVGQFTFEKA